MDVAGHTIDSMRRPGLSLVELIVVMSVIAILVAIIVPTLSVVRAQAKAAACRSNQRQLLTAFVCHDTDTGCLPYALDSRGTRPPGALVGNMMYDPPGWWWFHCLGLKTRPWSPGLKDILYCPAKRMEDISFQANVLWANYGVNWSLCKSKQAEQRFSEFKGTPPSMSEIKTPGQTCLVLDSGYAVVSWWYATDSPPVPPIPLSTSTVFDTSYVPGLSLNAGRDFWPIQAQDAIGGRHPNRGVNVGYVDGHVSQVRAEDLLVQEALGVYWNQSPLWMPR